MGTVNDMTTRVIGLVFLILCVLVFGYLTYKAWFDIESLRHRLVNQYNKMPDWHPMKEIVLRHVNSQFWVWEIRAAVLLALFSFSVLLIFLLTIQSVRGS
jgi:hypothetical protein